MPDIPIHNETDYSLTAPILDQIKREALEYFGESVDAIRVQYGIERHAFNAKTGEVRYAFSPSDYGLVDATSAFQAPYSRSPNIPSIDDEREEPVEITYDNDAVEVADEDEDEDTPTFGSLEDELDVVEDDDSPDFQSIETDFESIEDTDNDFLYDDQDDYE